MSKSDEVSVVSKDEGNLQSPETDEETKESERIQMEELVFLANTFAGTSATALQRGGQGDWIRLQELLQIMQPIGNALLQFHEVRHYLERLFQYIDESNGIPIELKLSEVLQCVFVDFKSETGNRSYPSGQQTTNIDANRIQECNQNSKKAEKNEKHDDLFQLTWEKIEKKLQPKQLNVIDIQRYLPRVVSEISRQESVWNDSLGLTLIAANTNIPFHVEKDCRPLTNIYSDSPKPSSVDDITVQRAAKLQKTGLEVVESLARSHSSERTKIWYLNLKESKHHNPYDLVVVSKNNVNSEHFVISVFGVLHVKPGGESELISLGQWYREATVFKTIRKIYYFNKFQIFKAFMLWKKNVSFIKFLKIRKQVKDSHLLEVPCMMAGIVQVKLLLSEMQDVRLLPNDIKSCYTLEHFNQAMYLILHNAKKYAEKLYDHCQNIVSKVEKDCLEFLEYSEFQIEQKSNNIKESMTLARQRRNKQLQNLSVAKYVEEKLPCFVRLIEEMLHQFMLCFISESISKFVYEVMGAKSIDRKGLFLAKFEFHAESSQLVLFPSAEVFLRSLKTCLESIPAVLSEVFTPLLLQQRKQSESAAPIEGVVGNDRLTVEELGILLKCGPKEAHEAFKQNHVNDMVRAGSGGEEKDSIKQGSCKSGGFLLEVRLGADKVMQNCISLMESLMRAAFVEVDEFAEKHNWIADIHSFVKRWDEDTLESWKGQTASKIEKQVQQIKSWIQQVSGVEKSMNASNGVLFVDGSHVQGTIVPGLQNIFTSMMDMIASHCLLSSEELIAELHETSKILSVETRSIEEFASFYETMKQCRESSISLQYREEYLKSIFEVVRHCYRQLTSDEEETDERLNSEWNSFLYVLQDANNKVNALLPQMLGNLESNISSLEDEATEITDKVTAGKFLNAAEDPKIVLPELKELHLRFTEIKEDLLKLVKCKEMIEEVPHDLTSLSVMHSMIIARHELWKYCEVTAYTLKDWMQTPFSKFQVKKVVEKVTKWREAIVKLKKEISSKDDVLNSWINKVEDFGVDLPLLLELSSVTLKPRHWKWLFAGLGQVYDQAFQYLVCDLVGFGLRQNSQLVISICDSAAAEYALESHLKKLVKRWEEEEFKLMKYFQTKKAENKKKKKPQKLSEEVSLRSKEKVGKAASSRDMFILTGVNELQSQVENNLVTLQSMLVSPHLSEMRNQAEAWTGYLHQLKEILDMWISCQQKWLYLKKIFAHVSNSNSKILQLENDFDVVDIKYKEHMTAVLRDPKVLSVLEKKRGEKGYRELQGEILREMFFQLVGKQEEIIKSLDSYLDDIRAAFPRLFFLSNSEMLELLAISQDPKALIPFVRKCFPGIVNLKFVLPPEVSTTVRTQLDAALNAHLLEVVCLYGNCGEEMNLAVPVKPSSSVEKWLSDLEFAMKILMWDKMARCVEERLLYTPSIKKLLDGLGIAQKQTTDIARPPSARMKIPVDGGESSYWHMVYPFQCVLAAEEVIWTSRMTSVVEKKGFESIDDVRKSVSNNLEEFSSALGANFASEKEKPFPRKLTMLIQSLLIRALHHREVTEGLDKKDIDEKSFEWLQCLKYHIEISHGKRRRVRDQHGSAQLLYGASNSAHFGLLSTSQMDLNIPYGYEYQGPTTRLVITPLTDKALFNLSTALKLHYTAALFGPTQSGKTETIQEVSKIVGSQLVTFTCQPSLSLAKILHFISGAIQSGALLCLENVTLLPDGILAVLGQHLDGIRQALSALQRREFSQFEIRDPVVAKETSKENIGKRKRGITVISLHTLLVNEVQEKKEDRDYDTRSSNAKPRLRRHSVAEIINVEDPRRSPQTLKKLSEKPVNFEMKLTQADYDASDDTVSAYRSVKPLGNVMVAGNLIKANPLFGCLMTLSEVDHHYKGIPDNLRNTTRLFGTIHPDYRIITEVWLISNGFKAHHKLSKKITTFRQMLHDQFLGDPVYAISLSQLKTAIALASEGCRKLKQEHCSSASRSGFEEKMEESCIGQAFYSMMFTSVYPPDLSNFMRLLKVAFPQIKDSIQENGHNDELLLSSVKQQIMSDSLLDKKDFIRKVMQLHETMFLNRSVILLGDTGTGKSACYQTLCRSLCQFYSAWTQAVKKRRDKKNGLVKETANQNSSFSKVHLSTFYHKAMENDELFGGFNQATQTWSDGLLAKLLRTATQLNTVHGDENPDDPSRDAIHYWFVFDGPLDAGLTEPLESLLDDRNELCLLNGERIRPPGSVKFLFETTNLSCASPAIIARSAIVNFENGLVDWRCIFFSWKKSARNKFEISTTGFKVIEGMLEHICDPLVEFLSKDGEVLMSNDPQMLKAEAVNCSIEVASILQMLGALLTRFISRENAERRTRRESVLSDVDSINSRSNATKANEEIRLISNTFAYAFVWAVSGKLHESCYSLFDVFTRQLFATCPYSVIFPCSVFDCLLDPANTDLVRWHGGSTEIPKVMPSHHYVVTSEIEKYFAMADLLVSSGSNVLIAGDCGIGKTVFVKNLLQQRHKMQRIVFSQGLSSKLFQKRIQGHVKELESRLRSNPMKPPPQQRGLSTNRNLFFIDDIAMANADPRCRFSQPSLEVLRQMISEGGVYDNERRYFQHLPNLQFVATCMPPICYGKGNAKRALSSRLTRRMNIINMVALSNESLYTIYTSIYKSWLEEFPAYSLTHIEQFSTALARASVDIFNKIRSKFTPTPTNPHFMFSHHDLARIAKGVFIYSPKSRPRPRRSGKGLLDRANSIVNQSLPDLKQIDSALLPNSSLSMSNIQTHVGVIDRSPASVSPLIRTIIRLWCHEVCRSFKDRMTDQKDLQAFSSILHNTVIECFCGDMEGQNALAPSNVHGINSRDSPALDKKTSKNRVKFKDIESSKSTDYAGPMINFKNLLSEYQSLTDLSFSKHLFIYGTRGIEGAGDHEKGYIECQDNHLEEALRKSLNLINSLDSKRMDLVLYKDALHHASRISRILGLAGGHALLVSLNGHGRANIVALVAILANMKLMTVSGAALTCLSQFRSIVKDACFVAGLQGRPVILFIPEGLCREGMRDVAALMVEGNCPGLYTQEELTAIGNHLLPGGQVGQRRTESRTVAQERFLRRISSNLHIFMCALHGSLNNIVEEFPSIVSRAACIDIYREWTVDILREVAERWLTSKGKSEFFFKAHWGIQNRDRQLTAIYTAMAHFHLTARAALDKDFRDLGLEVFSPLKFVEFIEFFRTICNAICKTREDELARLTTATGKINEGKRFVENTERSISDLTPILESAKYELKISENNVNTATKEYQASKQACIEQQKEIENLKEPIWILRDEAQKEFGYLTPIYDAALVALRSLDIHDVEEIRSYRAPPVGVKYVGDMLCTMFDKPANWEEAKVMLMRDNFFQDLIFYDKDKVSDALFKKLHKFSNTEESLPDYLKDISKAASSFSIWIRAVYNYCNVLRSLKPKQEEMKEAEKRLNKAKTLLGKKRVYSHRMKAVLEDSIELYKAKMKETKSLEKQLQSLNRSKKRADGLLESIETYTKYWEDRITFLNEKFRTAPGDALLTAATVSYLSAFGHEVRDKLSQDWMYYCKEGVKTLHGEVVIPIDENCSIVSLLSCDDEQMEWRRKGIPNDVFTLTNALCARTCSLAATKCWPLLIDPSDQASSIIRCIEEGLSCEMNSGVEKQGSLQETVTGAVIKKYINKEGSQNEASPRPNTKGNVLESSIMSEAFLMPEKDGGRISVFSTTDERDSETPGTLDHSDSRTSAQRRISTLSAITNESVFLKKFYSKAGLKDVSQSPPPSPLMEISEDTLMVVEADDVLLDRKMMAAVTKGVPTLVCHLERGTGGTFLSTILGKSISSSDDGALYVCHGKRRLVYHPNFRLYLSATVSMNFNKTNRFVLPLHKSLVINMAMSKEGLENKFKSLTIQSEKPELESQRKSLELDLCFLRHEKKRMQDSMLNTICEIQGKILEEISLSEVIITNKSRLKITEDRLMEGLIFQKELEIKRQDYYRVAFHASKLYKVILQISQLRPYYEMPLYFFDDLFKKTLSTVQRTKAASGSISARAAEIHAKFTLDLYRRTCLNVFKEHVPFFPLLMIAENGMHDAKIKRSHYEMFLKLCSIEDEGMHTLDGEAELNLDWLTNEVRMRVSCLESFEEFNGLLRSYEKHTNQWREYFSMPPNLACSCPSGYEELGIFHKSLMWLAVVPSKRSAICHSLILNSLGPAFTEVSRHNLAEVVNESKPSTPVVVLLPEEKQNALEEDAALAIEDLGRSLKLQVITLSVGDEKQLKEAARVIRSRKKTAKKWFILQNCHLEKKWSREFLRLIEEITEVADETYSKSSKNETKLFRLWFIFKCEKNLSIPVAISKKGLFVAWDEKIRSCENVSNGPVTGGLMSTERHISLVSCESYYQQKESSANALYSGVTAQRKFVNEIITNLQPRIPIVDERSIAKSIIVHLSSHVSYNPEVSSLQSSSTALELSNGSVHKSLLLAKKDTLLSSGREFTKCIKTVNVYSQSNLKAVQRGDANPQSMTEIVRQVHDVHQALSKKMTSRLSKAVYQFFHREIKATKEYCEAALAVLDSNQHSMRAGAGQLDVHALRKVSTEAAGSYREIRNILQYKSLQDWVRSLASFSNVLLSYIRPRSRQPLGFDINMIPHLKGFFASVMEDFCNENFANIEDIFWEGKVLQDSSELLPPLKGIYVKNLQFKNAEWNVTSSQLVTAANSSYDIPILHLVPYVKEQGKHASSKVSVPIVTTFSDKRTLVMYVDFDTSSCQEAIPNDIIHIMNQPLH